MMEHPPKPQESVNPDPIIEARKFLDALPSRRERKEVVPTASIDIKLDRGFLEQKLSEALSEEERMLWETMSRLPEELNFKPGVTIIVGRNGTGKTTLAKAIYIASLIEQEMNLVKGRAAEILVDPNKHASYREEAASDFNNPYNKARKDVLANRGKDMYRPAPLSVSAGLAVELSKAVQTKTVTTWGLGVPDRYVDVSSINGIAANSLHDNHQSSTRSRIGVNKEGYQITVESEQTQEEADKEFRARQAQLGSTRQSIDQILKPYLHGIDGYQGPRVVFIDEPEVGADPFRKKNFVSWLQQFVDGDDYEEGNPKSMILAPTNSSALFENKNLPRIDLRFPEAGIFFPEDRPGYYDEN